MEKKISYEEYRKALKEMRNELVNYTNELFPGKHSLVEIDADFGYEQPIETSVNWCAIGSVSAEDAVKFAELMTKAAELSRNFKYTGCYVCEF